MAKPIQLRFRQLNTYSWTIIIAFMCAAFAMQYHTASISSKDFFQALPLIVGAVLWCEKSTYATKQPKCNLNKTELFNRDLFLLSFSFLLGCLISLALSYDNSDAKSWWVFIIYFFTLYGLLFSLLFSVIALLLKNHRIYTMVFSVSIIALLSFGNFFPRYTSLPFIGSIDTFFVITGLMLIFHCFFAGGNKIAKIIFSAK